MSFDWAAWMSRAADPDDPFPNDGPFIGSTDPTTVSEQWSPETIPNPRRHRPRVQYAPSDDLPLTIMAGMPVADGRQYSDTTPPRPPGPIGPINIESEAHPRPGWRGGDGAQWSNGLVFPIDTHQDEEPLPGYDDKPLPGAFDRDGVPRTRNPGNRPPPRGLRPAESFTEGVRDDLDPTRPGHGSTEDPLTHYRAPLRNQSSTISPKLIQKFKSITGSDPTPEDIQQLRMLGIIK